MGSQSHQSQRLRPLAASLLACLVRCNAFENDNHFHFWSERSERNGNDNHFHLASIDLLPPPLGVHYTRASEASGCQAVQFLKCPQYKCTSACKKKRGVAERKTEPHGGLTFRREFRIGFRNLCHFFREVDHYKGITLRTTKVSFHRIFTFFINYFAISSPY